MTEEIIGNSTLEVATANSYSIFERWLIYLLEKSTDTSTDWQERPSQFDEQLRRLIRASEDELFEDGMESEFSRSLVRFVRIYGEWTIDALTNLIVSEEINPAVAAEALRWLGKIDHPSSYHKRLWLLEKSLGARSHYVRDAAVLGLASMDDPRAIPYLEAAILVESVEELREDMEQVLVQLKDTLQERR
jgi:hypothetical protein